MDLQLTNIEHFSECDVQAKIKQLRVRANFSFFFISFILFHTNIYDVSTQAFQQEIYMNTAKIELVFRQGEALIEKSEPLDAAVIEEELEELQRYCQEVFGRVERYYKKLTRLPVSQVAYSHSK